MNCDKGQMKHVFGIILQFISFLVTKYINILDGMANKMNGWVFIYFSTCCLLLLIKLYTFRPFCLMFIILAVISYMYVLYRIFKIIIRMIGDISGLRYYKITTTKEDHQNRLSLIGKIISFVIGILLPASYLLSYYVGTDINKSQEYTVYIILFVIYISILYGFLRYTNVVSTVFMILASTFLGIFWLLLFVLLILTTSLSLIQSGTIPTGFFPFENFLIPFVFLPKYYFFIFMNVFISVVIQLSIVLVRPVYLLSETKFAFKTVYLLCAISLVILVLMSSELKILLFNLFSMTNLDSSDIKEIMKLHGPLDSLLTENYVQRVVTIFMLPYTIGSLICMYVLEVREHINRMKAKKFFEYINYRINVLHTDSIVKYLKKSIYYGGETYKLFILNDDKFKKYTFYLR